ncbi:MAG TPA: zf-HC2 domain-containing protein [Candidatus Omnitrophota bacterium]|nr:zf-HC2 domain-containing protein [Candidatus Omnitrophota bacterium]
MDRCLDIQRLLSGYLDKEISVADSARIEAHVSACRVCSRELLELTRLKGIVVNRERKSLPPDFLVSRLREQIAAVQCDRGNGSWLVGVSNFARKLLPVPIAAVVLSTMVLILSLQQTVNTYSLNDTMLNGKQITTEAALGLMLGLQNEY